ncbi:MAG: GNAT family N-acetyltransferase [Saprospiraceae bacterium]|nr:GNAT family N-acetyltransferase [Saprospiraceae bacterium]
MNREERKKIYTSLCDQGKITGLFMQPWWLDAIGEWDVALAVRNDQVVGAMPYAPGRRWGIRTIGMPSLTHHLQIWMDKPPDISEHKWLTREKQIIWLLIDDLQQYGYFSMVFQEESFNNWLPFHWKGFRQEMRYTFVIDRMDQESLDQQINRNLKRNIKEASGGVDISVMTDASAFYAICNQTYQRQKMKMPYSENLFSKMDQAIIEHNAGIKLGAFDKDRKLIAVSYVLWDNKCAYYLLAGDNDAGRQSGASILLCREAMRIAFEEKQVATFDFCGSMLESISDVRRQFGARPVPLMKIFKAKYKWLDVLYSLTR